MTDATDIPVCDETQKPEHTVETASKWLKECVTTWNDTEVSSNADFIQEIVGAATWLLKLLDEEALGGSGALRVAAREVLARWDNGDLAAAMRLLAETLEEDAPQEKRLVVVVRGGRLEGVYTNADPAAATVLLDVVDMDMGAVGDDEVTREGIEPLTAMAEDAAAVLATWLAGD